MIVPLLLALVTLSIGVVLIVKSRRAGLPYPACGKCTYDLTGSIHHAERCPECGCAFADVPIRYPSAQRRPMMIVAGLALIACAAMAFVSSYMYPTIHSPAGVCRARCLSAS